MIHKEGARGFAEIIVLEHMELIYVADKRKAGF